MNSVVALDVDGVLNPYRAKNPHKHATGYHKIEVPLKDGSTIKVWVSPQHGERLLALEAQIVWATTWVTEPSLELIAEACGLPVGLPRISGVDHADEEAGNSGKREALSGWLDSHAPGAALAWLDDELGPDDRDWMKARVYPSLGVKPSPSTGLCQAHIDEVASLFSQAVIR